MIGIQSYNWLYNDKREIKSTTLFCVDQFLFFSLFAKIRRGFLFFSKNEQFFSTLLYAITSSYVCMNVYKGDHVYHVFFLL